jgi:hypothetical protein
MELTPHDLKVKVEAHAETEQEKFYRLIGSINLKPGLKLYALNLETLELGKPAIVKKKMVDFEGMKVVNDKTTFDPKCRYFQALNDRNAKRKAWKMIEKLMIGYDEFKRKQNGKE